MPPAQLIGIIAGSLVALMFLGFFFIPRGNGDRPINNDTAATNNNDDDAPPVNVKPTNSNRPVGGENVTFGGENLRILERFANEVRDVAGQVLRRFQDQFENPDEPSGLTMPMERAANQIERFIHDNRLTDLVKKDRADYHFTEITGATMDAYHKIGDLVEVSSQYSKNKDGSAEAMSAVEAAHQEVVDLCIKATDAIDAERERLRAAAQGD